MTCDRLELTFPLERTHCGIVMGNGNFGAMIWGRERLHVTVNRADFWDRRGGELIVPGTNYSDLVETARSKGSGKALELAIPRYHFPENVFKPQRLPVGRFEFSFSAGVRPVSVVLEYVSGTVTVNLSDGKMLLLDLSLEAPVLLLRDSDRAVMSVNSLPSWDFPQSREWLEKYAFIPPERICENVLWGWIQSCPEDPSLCCLCRSKAGTYMIALVLGEDNAVARRNAETVLNEFEPRRACSANYEWWKKYWSDVPQVSLPDEWFNCFYQYALYKFAAATHPNGYACGLQGPWIEEYQRAVWSGDYHFNVNVQEVYSLAFATGNFSHLLPLFDMIESESFMKALRHNYKVMFDDDDGLWFTHAVDDRGWQCGWLIPGSILDPACGAWTAMLYWNYYRYSNDREFLERRAFPFIRGIMRGYLAMMEEIDGHLSISFAISAEYGCSNPDVGHGGKDPSYQLAAAHMLADILIESAGVLQIEPEPAWRDIKQRLPHFSTVKVPDSCGTVESRIAIWEGQDLDICHRHHSHLAGIYPFETLSHPTPEQAEVIDNSIDHWILKGMGQWSEWCMPWAAIIYSRMDFPEAPMILLEMWKNIFVNEGLATVYLPRTRGIVAHRRHDLKKPKESSEIMQLDGTMGFATAILEMLVHMRGDVVYLFKGIPVEWKHVSFNNIRLPGGFSISAERGRFVKVVSHFGGSLKIEQGNRIENYIFKLGEEKQWPIKDL